MKDLLLLFSETEIFIFVFIEIITKLKITHRMLNHEASIRDKLIMVILFGVFSIFGTYVGITLPSGAISNVRDFGPIVAGLIGGPLVGLGAGVIGGVHRFFMGGFTNISCGLATMAAGLIAGLVYYAVKGRLITFYQGAIVAILVEIFHGLLTLAIARPFADALEVIKTAIPAMIIANTLGVIIAILLLTPHVAESPGTSAEH